MALKPYFYTAPSAWASYLVNNDSSGITPEEKKAADEFVAGIGMGAAVSCEDDGFSWNHDAWHVYPYGADCQKYTFLA